MSSSLCAQLTATCLRDPAATSAARRYAYVTGSPTAGGVQDAFYTDAAVSAAYQAHLQAMVSRVNSITGVVRLLACAACGARGTIPPRPAGTH